MEERLRPLIIFVIIIDIAVCVSTENQTKNEIWIGAFLTVDISAGGWSSEGVLPAIQMAIEDVNKDSTILTNYTLNMKWRDTKCQRGYGVSQLFSFLSSKNNPPIMLIGGGCSIATEATAEASHYWNLNQIAYSANSMRLSDEKIYPKLFRTGYSEAIGNPARIAILKKYGWKTVAAIYQNEGLFSLTLEDLRNHFERENITLLTAESLQNDPRYQVQNIKRKDGRIIIGMFYSNMARKVFCRAYKEQMYGARYQWLIPGWFKDKWWEDATKENLSCTPAQIKLAAGNYIAIMESTWSSDPRPTINGQTAAELNKRYKKRVNPSLVNEYCVFGYDAVWAVALALNKSIDPLQAQGKTLNDFRTNDTDMASLFEKCIYSLSYRGMSGNIKFDKHGDRIGFVVVKQLQGDIEEKVGIYDSFKDNVRMVGVKEVLFKGNRPPADRTLIQDTLLAISMPLFIIMSTAAVIGILVAIGFLAFNIHHSDKRLIRMSSPRLNSITVIGSMLVYTSLIIDGVDGKFLNSSQYTVLCQIQTWIFCIGFTLAYGAMFSKTWRVHILFLKKIERRSIKDHQLLAMVAGLLTIDIIILTTRQITDPLRYTIKFQPIVKVDEHHSIRPYIEYCSSDNFHVWQATILCYKGVLLLFGAFLAWETRKVTIPVLNDSKNIGISVYTVVLTCVIGVPVLIVVRHMQDFSYGLYSSICLLCTSISLCMLFIPKITKLGKREAELEINQQSTIKSRQSITVVAPADNFADSIYHH